MDALIVGPGEGERIRDTTTIKAARDELVVVEFDYPPGKKGPGLHIHREHADCFWILAGELTFMVGPDAEERRLGPDGFALVPPEVVHTFRNDGPAPARFLNIHAPGMGFDVYLRAMRDGEEHDFDSFDPPADGGRPVSEVHVVEPGEGERIANGPASLVIKAGREQRPGGLALLESTVAAGAAGPLPHPHERSVDGFYVLEGTLSLRLADRAVELGPGTYALAAPGTAHSIANETDEPARMLNTMAPAG